MKKIFSYFVDREAIYVINEQLVIYKLTGKIKDQLLKLSSDKVSLKSFFVDIGLTSEGSKDIEIKEVII